MENPCGKKKPKERNGESDTSCIKNIPKLSLFCKKNSWSCVVHLFLKPKAPRLIKLSLHLRELTAGTWKYPQKSPKRKRFETSTQTSNFWVQNVSFGGCISNMINPTNHPCGGRNQGFASASYDHYIQEKTPFASDWLSLSRSCRWTWTKKKTWSWEQPATNDEKWVRETTGWLETCFKRKTHFPTWQFCWWRRLVDENTHHFEFILFSPERRWCLVHIQKEDINPPAPVGAKGRVFPEALATGSFS